MQTHFYLISEIACAISTTPASFNLSTTDNEPDNSWLWEAVLCIVGCLAASLADPTDASSTPQVKTILKMSVDIAKCPLVGISFWLGGTAL